MKFSLVRRNEECSAFTSFKIAFFSHGYVCHGILERKRTIARVGRSCVYRAHSGILSNTRHIEN
jgi:hypothetical protein